MILPTREEGQKTLVKPWGLLGVVAGSGVDPSFGVKSFLNNVAHFLEDRAPSARDDEFGIGARGEP